MNTITAAISQPVTFLSKTDFRIYFPHPPKVLGSGKMGSVILVENENGDLLAAKQFHSREDYEILFNYDNEAPGQADSLFDSAGICLLAAVELNRSQHLQFPSIVTASEVVVFRDSQGQMQTYLLMEYVNGHTLADTACGSYNPQTSFRQILQLIATLKFVFAEGYIHNGLTDSNIMIDSSGNLKFVDLDSFDPIGEELGSSQEEYALDAILPIIELVLEKCKLSESAIEQKTEELRQIIEREAFQKIGEDPIESGSGTAYFIPLLDQMATLVNLYLQSIDHGQPLAELKG
jgi:serine/threonine protein kinase